MSDHDAIVAVDPCRRIIDAAESLLNRLNPNVPWSAEALELQHALVAWERVEAAEDRAGELQAQVERLEQERDEARAERSTVYKRGDDFAHHFWKERAVQAERERDEARAERSTLYQRGDDFAHDVWKERATSAEAVAQRYREALWSIASGAWMEDAPRHKYSVRVFARRALACDPLVCRDPDLCWGTGTCPRDPACNE